MGMSVPWASGPRPAGCGTVVVERRRGRAARLHNKLAADWLGAHAERRLVAGRARNGLVRRKRRRRGLECPGFDDDGEEQIEQWPGPRKC